MKIDKHDYYNEESIEIIEDFCSYYKSSPENKNTYWNSFRRFSEWLKKDDIRLFSVEDYNKLQNTNKSGHAKQLFRYLYAKEIIQNPNGFSSWGNPKDMLKKLEERKQRLNIPKETKDEFKPAISTQDLDKLISYINNIPNDDETSLKLAFCFYLLFFECVPVNVIKNIQFNFYSNGKLKISEPPNTIEVPKIYRFIWENTEKVKRYRGFSNLNDSIDQLCLGAGIDRITPDMINAASVQRFILCPECGKRYLGSTGNWVGINSYLVCNECSKKYINNQVKKKMVEQLTNYCIDFVKHSENIPNTYHLEDDLTDDDLKRFDSFDEKNPRSKKILIDRLVRETKISRELKNLYQNRCQVCGKRIRNGKNEFISEGHHLKPFNRIHLGDDSKSNMLILCPNHHAQFDRLYYAIEPKTHLIHCQFKDDENHHKKLHFKPGHYLDDNYLRYVWELFCEIVNKT